MARQVLIIDDELPIRQTLQAALQDEGYHVTTAASGPEGLEKIRSEKADVVLLDIWMPGMDGLETLSKIKQEWADLPVLIMSGHGNIETAVKATKLGAFDFLEKPLSLEKLLVLLQNVASLQDLARENHALRKQAEKHRTHNSLIGESQAARALRELVKRVAPTTGSVLITGENGTGKELVAHSIHALSSRYNKPFIEINCAAIPEELIESELFGHEKGAFTGAISLKRGKFDLAHGGTLFLDEIGDMSLRTQAKILRILQEQKFERVGGQQTISVDVRIVAATNKELKVEIQKGTFREDLYYRLNVIPFYIPPLRDRKEDIVLLADHFLQEFAGSHGRRPRTLTPEALAALTSYPWPGNVRELKNLVERMVILTPENKDGSPISAAELLGQLNDDALTQGISALAAWEGSQAAPSEGSASDTAPSEATLAGIPDSIRSLRDARQEFEKQFILKTLEEAGGNISKTAQLLGIERSHLHRKIRSFGVDPRD